MKSQDLSASPLPGAWATPTAGSQQLVPTLRPQAPVSHPTQPTAQPFSDPEDPNFPTAWVSACEAMGSIF
ncbi:hypothetical protein [Hymenobacter sp. BT730]|uniref:hypothetical protein n=1 Tax=Hymenobacter sp. BT730 TaxID=3063332 RepID=UPI0026E0DE6F|nr:hypothetical protein [Hymenobacter sp. BT730]